MKRRIFEREGGKTLLKKRMAVLGVFFVFFFSILVYRCLQLHLAKDSKIERIANSQYKTSIEEAPPRGNIYDAAGKELAVTVPAYSVAARPGKIKDRSKVLQSLAPLLRMRAAELDSRLKVGKKYVWLKRQLTQPEGDRIRNLSLDGVELVTTSRRYYPNREVASQILGAVGLDNEGLGGLEFFYDHHLKGDVEKSVAYRDARGALFETEETLSRSGNGPHHLHLTLRKNIQYVAETELNQACDRYKARACTAVVLDPHSGEVLAMASYPSFNPNTYGSYDVGLWRSLAVTDTFEPGSTFKVILATAALEAGVVRPEDKFFCENGAYRVGNSTIHDHEKYGTMSLREILKVSSNIGIYKVAQKLGKERFGEVIHQMGFGQKTGIDYPGETSGFVRAAEKWQPIEFANAAFGQGVRVTPIQLTSAFATIANGGTGIRPYLVSRITDAEGNTLMETKPKTVPGILKEQTTRQVMAMMREVTEEGGTGTKAALPGYTVAGKTGTAQKFVNGEYSHTKFMSSFIGMIPSESPRLVILVTIDEPKGVVYGGLVAAPVFRKIAWAGLRDLNVPPQKEIPREKPVSPLPLKIARASFLDDMTIPDLRGFSKRKVLSILDERGLRGQIIGSGMVVSQDPAPGSPLNSDKVLRLYFGFDDESPNINDAERTH